MYLPKKSHSNFISPRPLKCCLPRRFPGCDFVCISPITSWASLPSLRMHLSHQWFMHRRSHRLWHCHPNNILQKLRILKHVLGEKFILYNTPIIQFSPSCCCLLLSNIRSISFVDAVSVPLTK
jgi:hypothetical protein